MTDQEQEEEREDLYEHYKIVVDKGQVPLRIDKFLVDRLPNTSRNKIQNAAKNGNILVNGEGIKPNFKVKPNDEVSVVLPYPVREKELLPEDLDLNIVYEDEEVLVVNKKAGMVVHPGFGNRTGTLVNGLVYHFKDLPVARDGEPTRPGLVHRLDKNTSGLMVVAKTEQALNHLAKQFYDRTTERRYNALVWGCPKEKEGRIENYIGRSLKNRKIMQVFPEEDRGKLAITNYKIIQNLSYVSLIECKLETGRTHQIRIHCKHLGHPLFADEEYGGNKILKGTDFQKYRRFVENLMDTFPGQALHAKTLGFHHPVNGEWMFFDSELPDYFSRTVEKWSSYLSTR